MCVSDRFHYWFSLHNNRFRLTSLQFRLLFFCACFLTDLTLPGYFGSYGHRSSSCLTRLGSLDSPPTSTFPSFRHQTSVDSTALSCFSAEGEERINVPTIHKGQRPLDAGALCLTRSTWLVEYCSQHSHLEMVVAGPLYFGNTDPQLPE